MIGDSLEADVKGALNFGFNAIHLTSSEQKNDGEFLIINNLIELKKIL
jgi:FMN phosphatase YigB (HAD superfamily)